MNKYLKNQTRNTQKYTHKKIKTTQFLPKINKCVGYLQNYRRTDKKKGEKKINTPLN
jgi:hypothetical protein